MPKSLANIIFYLSLVLASSIAISDEQPKQWYQVEVVVFASNDIESGLDERWPEELGLQYPSNVSHISPALDMIESSMAEDIESIASNTTNTQDELQPLSQNGANNDNNSHDSTLADTQPLIAFSQLREEQLQLTEAANNIAKQYDFRPLFHKAWRQTIDNRENATSIIITGGEAYDEHFELEGSIKISVERYLHINTDLWLNQFVNKAGSEQPSWPLLPSIPRQIVEANASDIITLAPTQTNSVLPLETGLNNNSSFSDIEQAPVIDPLADANQALETQLAYLEDAQYSVEKTVVMRQHRRMRSKEIHYIDHPLFGMLIKIVPYELPLPEDQTES